MSEPEHLLDHHLSVTADVAHQAYAEAAKEGCKVNELIHMLLEQRTRARVATSSRVQKAFLEDAIEGAKRIKKDEEFTLESLFPDNWDEVPSRRAFGRLFKDKVEELGIADHVGRDNTASMARYRRR